MPRACIFIFLVMLPSVALADIYGFVDENGVVQISTVKVDERYFLFRKQSEPIVPPPISEPTEDMLIANNHFAELPPSATRKAYTDLITQVAREQDMDPALIHAVVAVESGFDPRAQSPKGARGLMQLMPGTAQRYGVTDLWNPLQNLRAGTRYLRDLLVLFKDNVNLALAAYNAGEGAVIGAGHAIPPFAETRSYVPRVLQLRNRLRAVKILP